MTHEGLFNCDPVQKVSLVVNSHHQTHKRVNGHPAGQQYQKTAMTSWIVPFTIPPDTRRAVIQSM